MIYLDGDEPEMISRVEKAIEWIDSKPEGHAKLEEAVTLHGHHVVIYVSSKIDQTGFMMHDGMPIVAINPKSIDHEILHGENGEAIQMTVERALAHELLHATQPNVYAIGSEYFARRTQISAEAMPDIPFDKYQHRFAFINGEADINVGEVKARELLSEIYDAHIGQKSLEFSHDVAARVGADPICQRFISDYEVPAIEFENLMMKKYKGEAGRTKDYAKSVDIEKVVQATDKDNYMTASVASWRAGRIKAAEDEMALASSRIGGRDPSEIRSDAGAKLSGGAGLGK